MRPLGGALFGHVADRFGRKRALVISVILMALPSFAIGILPTHAQIGIYASLLLVFMRILQGLAVGGEFTTSIVYLSEAAPKGKRGYFASWSMAGANGGLLLGSLIGAGVSFLLPTEQLNDWGWRIPFHFAVALSLVAFLVRRGMVEDTQPNPLRFPLAEVVRVHWRQVLLIIGLNAGIAVAYCTAFYYVSGWLVSHMHDTHAQALTINAICVATILVLVPLVARISDRIGRKPLLIAGSALLTILAHPLAQLMSHPGLGYALAAQLTFACIVSLILAPLPATLAEIFPANVRVTAVSMGYNIGWAIFGGTAPMVAAWLVGYSPSPIVFAWYVSAMAAITLLSAVFLRETSRRSD